MINFIKLINDDKCLKYFDKIKKLLLQLTVVGNIQLDDFKNFIKNLKDNHFIYLIKYDNNIVGMGTIFIENKIIHNFGSVGHIEDIVIDENFRGLGLGRKIITFLVDIGKKNKCYKIILNCNDANVNFYKKFGFNSNGNYMINIL